MVSDITGINYEILKDNIILETNELPISTKNEKAKRCDFIIRINNGNIINLELNSHCYNGLLIKNLSYLFNLFSNSTKKSEKYNDNLIIKQININCYKDKNYTEINPLSRYHLREDDTNKLYLKNVAIYELNVVKCHELYYNTSNHDDLPNYVKWGAFIYSNSIEEISSITKDILEFRERKLIMDKLNKLTREDLFYTEEEALEWAEWERNSIREEARIEGLKEGRTEGIEQGIEQGIKTEKQNTIIEMLKNNLDLELIMKITNTNKEEILKIKESL